MDFEHKTKEDMFKCQKCGDCCNGFGGTYVSEPDILNISAFINIKAKNFITKYCDMSGSGYVLTLGKDEYCIFFDKIKQCTIHPVKPYMCKAWPFIQTLIKYPENWNVMANSCPGMKKNVDYNVLQKILK